MENLNILVTGGCGFIGSNIVEYLLKNNVKSVRILDNLSTGFIDNINLLLKEFDNLSYIHGDISNLDTCRKAMKNIDVVCHQAALGSVPRSIDDPLSSHISNVNGFLNILISARENGIKRIVYASSSSVYGDHKSLPKVEEKIGTVLSPYAATKKIDEIYANVFSRCYGLECIGLRYFNVFGPRQNPNGAYAAVIPKFINILMEGKQPTINGSGNYSRDFTYIDNVVQANILALTTKNENAFGEVFNIGAGGRFTIIELFNTIKEEIGVDIFPIYGPLRDGDIPHSNASIDKANRILRYFPTIKFNEGIKKTVDYFKLRIS
jgi:UDP-N-acetylglucosamine 4-epimerase